MRQNMGTPEGNLRRIGETADWSGIFDGYFGDISNGVQKKVFDIFQLGALAPLPLFASVRSEI